VTRAIDDTRPDPSPATERGLPVDWELAARTAGRLMSSGPEASRAEAVELVGRLRADAADAEEHVRDITGMGHGLALLPADVVDRPRWAEAALRGMAALTADAELPAVSPVVRAVTGAPPGCSSAGWSPT
jgi:uncharacterized protein (DUF2342 family)